jgi:phosphatidylglycerophosphate synthase
MVACALIAGHALLPREVLEVAAVMLVASAAVLDVLDGVVFKRSARAGEKKLRDQRRVLDVVCDRVLIYGTVVPLAFIGFPLMATGLILGRELAAGLVCGVPYLRRGFVCAPNLASRIGMSLVGVQVVYYCLGNQHSVALSGAFLVVAVVGVLAYLHRSIPN